MKDGRCDTPSLARGTGFATSPVLALKLVLLLLLPAPQLQQPVSASRGFGSLMGGPGGPGGLVVVVRYWAAGSCVGGGGVGVCGGGGGGDGNGAGGGIQFCCT